MNRTMMYVYTGALLLAVSIVYFIVASEQLYPRQPQFIPLYYPIGLGIGFFVLAALNGYFVKGGWSYLLSGALLLMTVQFGVAFAANGLYGSILADYYRSSPYSTLLGMPQYAAQKGNLLTIHQEMLREGAFARTITTGYSTSGKEDTPTPEDFAVPLTYRVGQAYIIYDWTQRRIVNKADESEIIAGAKTLLEDEAGVSSAAISGVYQNYCNIEMESGGSFYKVRVFAREGRFSYALQE